MGSAIRPLVAGNWKMNGMRDSLAQIKHVSESSALAHANAEALICVPATLLYSAAVMTIGTPLRIGAQNCHHEEDGAYTGDISAGMIADSLGSHALVGHSERRLVYSECDASVRAKAVAAHKASLTAIICIGETEKQRDSEGSVAKNPVMGERALVIFGEISDERFQVAPLSG